VCLAYRVDYGVLAPSPKYAGKHTGRYATKRPGVAGRICGRFQLQHVSGKHRRSGFGGHGLEFGPQFGKS